MLGFNMDTEVSTVKGLFDKTLDEAFAQIKNRGYADKYRGVEKSVYVVAFAFLVCDEIEMRSEEWSQ